MANMAGLKKACKVQVLVRLRPEHLDYKEKSDGNGIPQRCVRAVDSSTLEIWNCRNSKESIRYRLVFGELNYAENLNYVCIYNVCVNRPLGIFIKVDLGVSVDHLLIWLYCSD